ncbi:MAG TPA: L-fucose:H+ symporter permease [Acidobacteriaceae bacterium]
MIASTSVAEKETGEATSLIPPGMCIPFALVTSLFFLWGVPNNLNDVLIRQFMKSFAISRFQAGLVQSAFYLGYFLLATPAALLMRRYGYKFGFLAGLCLLGTGTLLFWPAAIVARYSFFLFALFVIASGLSFLETAANPFIAQLGGGSGGARRLNFSQAFNPLGSIIGVLVGTIFIFSGVELSGQQVAAMQAAHTYEAYLRRETLRVVDPYLILGVCAFFLAFLVWRTHFPMMAGEQKNGNEDHGNFRDLLHYPHFLLAILTQFMYVGAQVGTWSYFIQYVQDATHQPEKVAGYFLTGTLAAFGVGRFSSAVLMKYVSPGRLMGVYSVVNIALVATGILHPGWLGLWAIFSTSFFMSVMYPTIFVLGIDGLGANTKIGGSLIIMAIVGGAVLTPLMGLLSQSTHSIAVAYAVPLVGYLFVAFYAFIGCGVGRKTDAIPFAVNL